MSKFQKRDLEADQQAYVMQNWEGSARLDQIAPRVSDWSVWLVLGGRGSGKTRTGAEWVLQQVRRGAERIALVAPTLHDAREVMLGGESGLLRIGFRHERARYEPTRRRVVFPALNGGNSAVAYLFSAHDPDSLRGPQFDCAWGDEFCAWPDPDAVLSNLRLGLRMGQNPQLCLTSTPRPLPMLDTLLANSDTRVTRSRTYDNAENLAPGFIQAMSDTYGGSALGRQELDGEIVRDHSGAIFSRADIDQGRVIDAPPLDRILVALDPPATSGETADRCGLVVVGRCGSGRGAQAYVLRDASLPRAAPKMWAERAVALYHSYEADGILAESNQGGEMIEAVIHQIDPDVPVLRRHATRSKRGRATPVGLLYARGRVHHVGLMAALEDELCAFGGPHQKGSPDRMDALVWGVSELLLGQSEPRLRFL